MIDPIFYNYEDYFLTDPVNYTFKGKTKDPDKIGTKNE